MCYILSSLLGYQVYHKDSNANYNSSSAIEIQQIQIPKIRMEYSVIKLIDGLLITDSSILHDHEFLYNNKISHIFAWLPSQIYFNVYQYQDIGIKAVAVAKGQDCVPELEHVELCVRWVQESKEELLCCVICCEDIVFGLGLLVPYFVCRYGWMFETAVSFLEQRLKNVKVGNLDDYLRKLRAELPRKLPNIAQNNSRLKQIHWNASFLAQYQTDDMEELILINTVKNTLVEADERDGKTEGRKKKRIQWFDELAKNSITAGQRLFANSRINSSLKKSSNLKNYQPKTSIKLNSNEQLLPVKPEVKGKQELTKRMGHSMKENQFDDFQYLSLKEMSRTNFDDIKFRGQGLRKRKSLKVFKKSTQKVKKEPQLKSIQATSLTLFKSIKPLQIQNP